MNPRKSFKEHSSGHEREDEWWEVTRQCHKPHSATSKLKSTSRGRYVLLQPTRPQELKMRLALPRTLLICLVLLFPISPASADEGVRKYTIPWPDSFVTRLEALALLQTLNADLLSHDSATLTLERWCDTHHMASPARIVAERVKGADKQATAEQLQLLGVSTSDAVRYRRVRLQCGAYILSEADNWYVPARLTDDMNRLLDSTETSFGRAVQALNFRRRTLSAKLLWLPLPEGWETDAPMSDRSPAMLGIPHTVLEHRAVLTLPDGTPFSEVVETYTGDILAFPPPSGP
jgi:chorismate-pyruvate lyase